MYLTCANLRALLLPAGLQPWFSAIVEQHNLSNIFSMEMCQPFDYEIYNGQETGYLTLGGVPFGSADSLLYTPLQAEAYYSVQVNGMAVGGVRLPLTCADFNAPTYSVVDSGTTNVLVPHLVFNSIVTYMRRYLNFVPSKILDGYFAPNIKDATYIPVNLLHHLPDVSVMFPVNATHEFEVRMTWQNYMHNVTNRTGATVGAYFGFSPICIPQSGSTLGMSLLTAATVVYDRQRKRIGFANTSSTPGTQSKPNPCARQMPAVFGPNEVGVPEVSCASSLTCSAPVKESSVVEAVSIAMAVVGGLLAAYSLIFWPWKKKTRPEQHRAQQRKFSRCIFFWWRQKDSAAADVSSFDDDRYDNIQMVQPDDDDDALLEIR